MQEYVLEISNLKKFYKSDLIIDDFSLNVKKGEVIVIIGPSGCGKSTLLRCINGLENFQKGQIKINGEEINKVSDTKRIRRKIGMVFQNYELFPHLNVLDNIMLAPIHAQRRDKKEVKEEAIQLLKRVGLEDKATSFPRQLSGGQKQRIAIVRTLAVHPDVLLFDEVTAALDPEMVREVLDVIFDFANQGKTMLVVTHEMQFAKAVADRVIFFDNGKICEQGTSSEFFNNPKTERAKSFLSKFVF